MPAFRLKRRISQRKIKKVIFKNSIFQKVLNLKTAGFTHSIQGRITPGQINHLILNILSIQYDITVF